MGTQKGNGGWSWIRLGENVMSQVEIPVCYDERKYGTLGYIPVQEHGYLEVESANK